MKNKERGEKGEKEWKSNKKYWKGGKITATIWLRIIISEGLSQFVLNQNLVISISFLTLTWCELESAVAPEHDDDSSG